MRPDRAGVYNSYLDDVLGPVLVLVGLRLERLEFVPQRVHTLQHVGIVDLKEELSQWMVYRETGRRQQT